MRLVTYRSERGPRAGVRKPPVWLKPGDEIVISSPTLGELVTRVGRQAKGAS